MKPSGMARSVRFAKSCLVYWENEVLQQFLLNVHEWVHYTSELYYKNTK